MQGDKADALWFVECFAGSIPSHVIEAERLHPKFNGLECVVHEFADLVKAVESGDDFEIQRQCKHLAVVACRLFVASHLGKMPEFLHPDLYRQDAAIQATPSCFKGQPLADWLDAILPEWGKLSCGAKATDAEVALLRSLRQHEDGDRIAALLAGICGRLAEGRAKHERFAENVFHGISFFEAEVGETVQEIVKQRDGWELRMNNELIDSIVVAIRLLLHEYEHNEEEKA